MKKALFWEKEDEQKVRCQLCPHHCLLTDNDTGLCRVRQNREGVLYALTYGKVVSIHLDPVEKKPLYHFFPGRNILSIGSVGCNLRCQFCQNWEISQKGMDDFVLESWDPEKLLQRVVAEHSIGLAYTYNEPFIWWEFVRDTARLIHQKNLSNVLVTNGYVEEEPLRGILPYIDAMNIDLKSMDDHFYRVTCGGSLSPVLRTIELSVQAGVHVEVTNLLIPGLNDQTELIEQLVSFIASLSPDIPLHFSRFFPAFRLNVSPTPGTTLERAYQIGRKKLRFVYLGNVEFGESQCTRCPFCGEKVVSRQGYSIDTGGLLHNRCRNCGRVLPIWNG
ncbi:MAG: AmmeMemoRadiSam system radical SAM enzyme [Candidatus Atribacteria bacterium]|nr:AmmeMemoRadiSam system radical SAM enzyme [Candidatus Atribacteria bacterium]